MRLGLVSAKGSPGVTTLGLAIAAATGGVLLELDPAGGDVGCWAGPRGEPPLIRLVAVLRHAASATGVIEEHAVEVASKVRVVWAPPEAERCEAAQVAIGDRLAPALRAVNGWVVVDGGRWSRSQPTADRLAGCDVVAVMMSATVAGVAHAAATANALVDLVDVPVVGVLVGDRGYRPAEVAGVIDLPVLGPVPWDARWADALPTSGVSRMWQRSGLARSARSLVDNLTGIAASEVAASG